MTMFANDAAFHDSRSLLRAMGTDLSPNRAIVDSRGQVLAYAKTGGMMNPSRFELRPRETIYRFGGSAASLRDVAMGAWWIQKSEFEQLLRFANTYEIFVGLAMRMLC